MKRILLVVLVCMIGVLAAVAQDSMPKPDKKTPSLPRFVSLRSQPVNARSGPGVRYPIEWVYMQKSAPIEIIAEFEDWRRVRDWQGSESWIKDQMLSASRYVRIKNAGKNNIYAKSNTKSPIIAKVEDGVVGKIKKCPAHNEFCLISFNDIEGWIPRQNLYGIYDDEIID